LGSDIYFGQGRYDESSSGGQRLLAHEVAHTVQQREAQIGPGSEPLLTTRPGDPLEREADRAATAMLGGNRTPGLSRGVAIARQAVLVPSPLPADKAAAEAEPDMGTSVQQAGEKAAEQYQPRQAVTQSTTVDDVNKATDMLNQAKAAIPTLTEAVGQPAWGEAVEQKHIKANQNLISNLETYLTYAGEETRTMSDFQVRYIKASRQFMRLSGMVEQYSARSGTDVGEASALVNVETGKTAGAAGSAVKDASKGKGGKDLRDAANRVKDLRRESSKLREEINENDGKVRELKKDCLIAAKNIEKAAADKEKAKKEEDSAAVAEVKAQMAEVKKVLSIGVEAGKAAIPFDKLPGGKPAQKGAEKAVDYLADKVLDAALEEVYKVELERAKAVQTKASAISASAQQVIDVAQLQKASGGHVKALEKQQSSGARFDAMMADLRAGILELGQTADQTMPGGGYSLMAQFLAESDVYLQESDIAIGAGKVQQEAGKEATGAHAPMDVTKDPKAEETILFYKAQKVAGKYEVTTIYCHLNRGGPKSAQGDTGQNKTVELMIEDLKADQSTVRKYQVELNQAMGL
jgi:hypothetical protein